MRKFGNIISVQYLFIDFQKAYDAIHRDKLWKCMEELKIPNKLINMCKTCAKKKRSTVRNRRNTVIPF